jgi:hypothetical protein
LLVKHPGWQKETNNFLIMENKYDLIAALTPATENFDESAIVNEGGYLSVAHLDAIEDKLKEDAASIAAHPAALASLQTKLDDQALQAQQSATELTTATTTMATQATTITELEAKIAVLQKKPATTATSTTRTEDIPPVGGAKKAAHLDPENSLNKAADSLLPKFRKQTVKKKEEDED